MSLALQKAEAFEKNVSREHENMVGDRAVRVASGIKTFVSALGKY